MITVIQRSINSDAAVSNAVCIRFLKRFSKSRIYKSFMEFERRQNEIMRLNQRKKRRIRFYSFILLFILLIMPDGFAASQYKYGIVTASNMIVYRDGILTESIGSLAASTIIKVEPFNGDVVKITYHGKSGYAQLSDIGAIPADTNMYAKQATRVYQKPDLDSRYIEIPENTTFKFVGISGSCVCVQKNGIKGYMYIEHLGISSVVW